MIVAMTKMRTTLSKINQLELDIQRLQNKLDAIKRLPENDEWANNGSMIMLKRTFPGSDTVYAYVGIRQNGVWWLSTRSNMRSNTPMVWDGLIEWLGAHCVEMWHLEIESSLIKEAK